MNAKILRDTKNDMIVGRQLSNMMLQNYTKGLAIANEEQASEDGIADSVTTIDPTKSVRIKKQKGVTIDGPGPGYKIKAITTTKKPDSASSQLAKDFITQSKALDNELDHVLAHMKYNNKEEFYDRAKTNNLQPAVYKEFSEKILAKKRAHPQFIALQDEHDELMHEIHRDKIKNNRYFDEHDEYDDALTQEIEEKEDQLQVLARQIKKIEDDIPDKSEVMKTLSDKGATIDVERKDAKGKHHEFKDTDADTFESTTKGTTSHIKSKKGVRVVNTIDVADFSQDLLLEIKKIANFITVTIMPLAQKLYNTHFQGIDLQEKDVTIPELYKEMDEKMYVLASLNNVSNTQLVKLDKDFDKLYNMVKNGLASYVMPTSSGGSMTGGAVRIPLQQSNAPSIDQMRFKTDYLYEL
jgi:predicted  nucleic acid-binding Zn-ribbon protein